jgi:hypothetical protein
MGAKLAVTAGSDAMHRRLKKVVFGMDTLLRAEKVARVSRAKLGTRGIVPRLSENRFGDGRPRLLLVGNARR